MVDSAGGFDALIDHLGPCEGSGISVVAFDTFHDGALRLPRAAKGAAAGFLLRRWGDLPFHQLEPAAVDWHETVVSVETVFDSRGRGI